jgi:hypothetical protein
VVVLVERTVASLVVLGACVGGRKKKKKVFRRERERVGE